MLRKHEHILKTLPLIEGRLMPRLDILDRAPSQISGHIYRELFKTTLSFPSMQDI